MNAENKNDFTAKNSNGTDAPIGAKSATNYNYLNYSELDEFFTREWSTQNAIEALNELRSAYLEMSLFVEHAVSEYGNVKRLYAHENVHQHADLLKGLIGLIKSLKD